MGRGVGGTVFAGLCLACGYVWMGWSFLIVVALLFVMFWSFGVMVLGKWWPFSG